MASSWVYIAAIAALVAFCFWKPDFPKLLAPRIGIRGGTGLRIFLAIYWIAIPIVIHRLMSQVHISPE